MACELDIYEILRSWMVANIVIDCFVEFLRMANKWSPAVSSPSPLKYWSPIVTDGPPYISGGG